jgi:hypothetical protein
MTSIEATSKLIPCRRRRPTRRPAVHDHRPGQRQEPGPVQRQAAGFSGDGEGDGRVSACEHFALAISGLRRRQVQRTWSPGPAHPHRGQRR